MKHKRKISFILAVFITLSLFAGCGNSQKEDSFSNDSNEIISTADARRNEFYHNITDVESAGMVYYISNSGNDNNDGLSPETAWATLDRVFDLTRDLLRPGDTVLLERGGTWYISPDEIEGLTSDAYNIVDGVTLGAYGEGARPLIRGDIPETNTPAFWELYYDENGVKIWSSVEALQDSNVIVFNDGESYADEVMPYWSTSLNDYCNAEGDAFDIKTALVLLYAGFRQRRGHRFGELYGKRHIVFTL